MWVSMPWNSQNRSAGWDSFVEGVVEKADVAGVGEDRTTVGVDELAGEPPGDPGSGPGAWLIRDGAAEGGEVVGSAKMVRASCALR